MRASPRSELSAIVPLPDSVKPGAAFHPVAGQPALVRIARDLVGGLTDPARVVVAATEGLVGDIHELLASAGLTGVGVASVERPATRARCLAAGLKHLPASTVRYVLVHDIRQPLIPGGLCDRVIAHLIDGGPVVLPTLPVTDSVKAVDADGTVAATLDRSTLRVVQYPRGFAVDHLASLLTGAEWSDLDDEAEAAIHAGMPIAIVTGDAEAFLADLPDDAVFVEAVIASRPR